MCRLFKLKLIRFFISSVFLISIMIPLGVFAANDASKRMPFSLALGKTTYNKNCMDCHGEEGVGSDKGPPLIHKYYEPSHHSDTSFYRAMTVGVKQHHWKFGDMKAVPGLSDKKMRKTIEYVRWLQRQQGIH